MRTRSSLLRASWARRSDSRPAHLMVLSLSKNMIIGFYLWKKNESQLRIPPCIRHLCWRVFLTDQLRPNQKDWYSFFCISRMYWNHFETPLFCLHSCQQGKPPPKKSRSDQHLERYSSRPKLHAGPFFPFDWLHPGLLHPPSLGPRSKLLLLSRANWCFFTFYGI